MEPSKLVTFFEKTCQTYAVAIISFLTVLLLVWMFYLLSGIGL